MAVSGYSASTRAALGIGAGIVTHKVGADEYVRIGITTGGLQVDLGEEMRNVEFDGKAAPIRGLDFVTYRAPTITCTFKELSEAGLEIAMQNAAFASTPPVDLTPHPANALYPNDATRYLENLRVLIPLGDGTTWQAVTFFWALARFTGLQTQDRQEATWSAVFEARLNPAGSPLDLDAAPFDLQRITSPTIL